MKDDLRPRGTVEVRCDVPGCRWALWVDPLDSRLPNGPFDCGADHVGEARVDAKVKKLEELDWHMASCTQVKDKGAILIGFGYDTKYLERPYVILSWSSWDEFEDLEARLGDAKRMDYCDAHTLWDDTVTKVTEGAPTMEKAPS